MIKKIAILPFVALIVSACATQAPLDDAYHWESKAKKEKKTSDATSVTSTNSTSSMNSTNSTNSSSGPMLEYVNVQDTTVTVRIKR